MAFEELTGSDYQGDQGDENDSTLQADVDDLKQRVAAIEQKLGIGVQAQPAIANKIGMGGSSKNTAGPMPFIGGK